MYLNKGLFCVGIGLFACTTHESQSLGNASECSSTEKCGPNGIQNGASGGASSESTEGTASMGSGGSSAEGVDVSGTVSKLVSSGFDQTVAYSGQATVSADAIDGTKAETSLEGSSFALNNVSMENKWLLLNDDENGSTGIFSTFYYANLETSTEVEIEVMDREVWSEIAFSLPIPTTITEEGAHIVLQLLQDDLPVEGYRVTNTMSGATIAYDEGSGYYSNEAIETGAEGMLLILNASASSSEGELSLDLVGNDGEQTIVVPLRSDTVTFGRIELE